MLSRRLWSAAQPSAKCLRLRPSIRYVSFQSTRDKIYESYRDFVDSNPTSDEIAAYKNSPRFEGIVKHLESLGVTKQDVDEALRGEYDDPDMTGGMINPPRIHRALRDPYGDWWDKQDRRNYGEPVHTDHDILGTFSLEPYNHFPPGKALAAHSVFWMIILGISGTVYCFYPDKPAVPRTFPRGLEEELGGKDALILAPSEGSS